MVFLCVMQIFLRVRLVLNLCLTGAGQCVMLTVVSMIEEIFTFTQEVTATTPWLLPLVFGLFGACVGSFLNVVIYRMPRGMSVNEPRRSFCPQCKALIPWYLNLPVISYVLLRGRTACCGKHYTARYCVVELVCALLFAALSWYFCTDDIITQLMLCVWAAAMLACFCID